MCRAGPLDADVESADVDALEHDLGRIEDTDSALAVAAAEIERLRRMTISVAAALTLIPFVSDPRMEPSTPPPSMVVDLVMVTVPKPSGSSTEMTPAAAVLLIAPAKVLQGAVRQHGLASSPTPMAQVRIACACAPAASPRSDAAPNEPRSQRSWRMSHTSGVEAQSFASAIDSRQRLVLARAGKRHGSTPACTASTRFAVATLLPFIL